MSITFIYFIKILWNANVNTSKKYIQINFGLYEKVYTVYYKTKKKPLLSDKITLNAKFLNLG